MCQLRHQAAEATMQAAELKHTPVLMKSCSMFCEVPAKVDLSEFGCKFWQWHMHVLGRSGRTSSSPASDQSKIGKLLAPAGAAAFLQAHKQMYVTCYWSRFTASSHRCV